MKIEWIKTQMFILFKIWYIRIWTSSLIFKILFVLQWHLSFFKSKQKTTSCADVFIFWGTNPRSYYARNGKQLLKFLRDHLLYRPWDVLVRSNHSLKKEDNLLINYNNHIQKMIEIMKPAEPIDSERMRNMYSYSQQFESILKKQFKTLPDGNHFHLRII